MDVLSPKVLEDLRTSWELGGAARAAAWELYVDLAFLLPAVRLDAANGSLTTAVDALEDLCNRTADVLKRSGPAVASRIDKPGAQAAPLTAHAGNGGPPSFAEVARRVVDEGIRPLVEAWRPRLAAHEARAGAPALDGERELTAGLGSLLALLDAYESLLLHHGSMRRPVDDAQPGSTDAADGERDDDDGPRLLVLLVDAWIHSGPAGRGRRLIKAHREWVRTGYRSQRWALLQDYFVPLPPRSARTDRTATRDELEDGIPRDMSVDMAQAVLDEARAIYAARDARLERINARATMLQSAVGIATSLLVAAMALLLDTKRVPESAWRDQLALALGLLVFCLGMTGWMAARATLTRFVRARPRSRNILRRFVAEDDGDRAAHLRAQAIDLLDAANANDAIDVRRSAMLESARLWYRWALVLTLVLTALLVRYAFFIA